MLQKCAVNIFHSIYFFNKNFSSIYLHFIFCHRNNNIVSIHRNSTLLHNGYFSILFLATMCFHEANRFRNEKFQFIERKQRVWECALFPLGSSPNIKHINFKPVIFEKTKLRKLKPRVQEHTILSVGNS